MYSIRPSMFVILFVLLSCLFALSGCDKEDNSSDGEGFVTVCSGGHCRRVKVETTATTDITAETLKTQDKQAKASDDTGDVTISKVKDGVLIQYFHVGKDGNMTEYSPGAKASETKKEDPKVDDSRVKERAPLKYEAKPKLVEDNKVPAPLIFTTSAAHVDEFYTNPTTGQKLLVVYEGDPAPPTGVTYVRKTHNGDFVKDPTWLTTPASTGNYIEVNGCKTCWRLKE